MSFPPVLNGFSHCRIHRAFDPACRMLPPWLRSFSRCAHSTATVRPIFHPAVPADASAPSLTLGLGLPVLEFRGGVPVPVSHGVTGSRQSTRWLGPWVTPSDPAPRPATASPNTLRIRRSAPAYPKSHSGIEIFAPICACPWRRTPGGAHSDLSLRGSFQWYPLRGGGGFPIGDFDLLARHDARHWGIDAALG